MTIMMLSYPAILTPDTDGIVLVDFPDVPIAHSVANDRRDVLANAIDALETAFELYVEQGKPVPLPSSGPGATCICVPPHSTARVLLWNEMLAQKMRDVDLADRLGVPLTQIRTLFRLTQPCDTDLIEKARGVLERHASSRNR